MLRSTETKGAMKQSLLCSPPDDRRIHTSVHASSSLSRMAVTLRFVSVPSCMITRQQQARTTTSRNPTRLARRLYRNMIKGTGAGVVAPLINQCIEHDVEG